MARKSMLQRQRDLNLRGRSITRSQPARNSVEGNLEDGEMTPMVKASGPTEADNSKLKNINEITGMTELVLDSKTDEENVVSDEHDTDGKQSTLEENRVKEAGNENSVPEMALLQLEREDVQEEVDYWQNAVVCFILGANPHATIIEGFIRRIWTRFNIDKLSFLPNGIFLVRFKTLEMKEQVLKSGHYLFDNKPMIVNPWTEELELHKTEVKNVPVWIQLHGLPIKYWGKSLPKIAGIVGKFLQTDKATDQKTKLAYARIMVEMTVNHPCPENIQFINELGVMQTVEVHYEWKPVNCTYCSGMGHNKEECMKLKPPKTQKPPEKKTTVWKPVPKTSEEHKAAEEVEKIPKPAQSETTTSGAVGNQGGFSSSKFGDKSYKEILSPTYINGKYNNGNASPSNHSNG
ncbi:hypothetical protein vseg_003627 [Gypsophila vaccaria]